LKEALVNLLFAILSANAAITAGSTFDEGKPLGYFWLIVGIAGGYLAGQKLMQQIKVIVGEKPLFSQKLRDKRVLLILAFSFVSISLLLYTHF
jgi:hypothetical protein